MAPSIDYYCSCMSEIPLPPPPRLLSSSASFHPLHTLFFCEECDAVRCNRCVSIEVSGYYCPNCLFEVPSASVRAERNRCARNCFQCPHCRNTLSVVPSDPPENGMLQPTPTGGTLGEPPFLLYCNNCRWDSAEVNITFEKPTGLAQQLQRFEDSAPEFLEFERLKDFFEPILRSALSSSHGPSGTSPMSHHSHHGHGHMSALTAAASSALARDIPGVGKHMTHMRTVGGAGGRAAGRAAAKHGNKDDVPVYRARLEVSGGHALGAGGDGDAEMMRHLEHVSEISRLEQRWGSSWAESPLAKELKPIRIPLHSRLTKRCPACRHILIKPEQKAQSVRYKIKLVAANYLPAISIGLPLSQQPLGRRGTSISQKDDDVTGRIQPGRTYPFHLLITNPLYDPIQIRLAVQRQTTTTIGISQSASAEQDEGDEKSRKPSFAVSLPSFAFSIAAFAEAWEYEDDEEMFGLEDEGATGRSSAAGADATPSRDRVGRLRSKTVGVLEKKANTTLVGGEIVVSKDGRGDVKFNCLVSYTYRSDEPQEDFESNSNKKSSAKTVPEMKTFTFYTLVNLGTIAAKDED